MYFTATVYDPHYVNEMHVEETDGGLTLTTFAKDRDTVITLDDAGAHRLLLALQQFERKRKADRKTWAAVEAVALLDRVDQHPPADPGAP